MKASKKGLDLIKEYEGFRATAYICPSGKLTIGYGCTYYSDGSLVKRGDTITKKDAGKLLEKVVEDYYAKSINDNIKVPLTQNQFDALVSFIFNCGIGAFVGSTLRKLLNQKDYKGAAEQFLRWDKGNDGKPIAGLTRRRKAERELFICES